MSAHPTTALARAAPRPRSPSSLLAAADRASVSGNFVSALLLICVFAPYGMLPGDLRLDHLAVHIAMVVVLVRRAGRVPPLAAALLAVVGVAIIGTAAHLDIFLSNQLQAFKHLDGLLRGPFVYIVAASLGPDPRELRRVVRTLVLVAVVLTVFALGERLLAIDSTLCQFLVERYGGVVYDTGAYRNFQVNHKYLMLLTDRASAVFGTAPSLAFAGVFFVALGVAPIPEIPRNWRVLLVICGAISGLAANSKSFILGVPLFFLLSLTDARLRRRVVGWPLVILGTILVLAMIAASAYGLVWNPLERSLAGNDDTLSALSAGRYSESGSILDVSVYTLFDSPLYGYGITNNMAAGTYADSGLNKFVVHSGIVGTIIAFAGIGYQFVWYYRRRNVSPWASLGAYTLLVALSFFFAGAIFQMPRINDILFVILGIAYARLAVLTGTGMIPLAPSSGEVSSTAPARSP